MQKFQEKCNTIITDIDEGIMTNLALAAGIGLGNNSLGKDSTPINLAVTAPSIAQTSINNIVKVVNGNPELKSVLDKAGGWKVVSPAVIVTLLCETGPECSSEERKHVWNIILNRTHNKNAFPGITTTTQAVLQGIGNTKLAKAFSFWGDSKNSNFKRVNDIKSLTGSGT